MKRRSFVKKSVAAAIVAATPMALTGLVNAEGGGYGSDGGSDTTSPFTFADATTTTWMETTPVPEGGDECSEEEMNNPTGVENVEQKEEDSSGKDIKCQQSINCSGGKTCIKVWGCKEWHASAPSVCKEITLGP